MNDAGPSDTPDPEQDPLPDFEKSMAELEALVERMETGEQPLEAALADFERGIQLTRHCQQALTQARQKVDILLEERPDSEVGPFDPDGS